MEHSTKKSELVAAVFTGAVIGAVVSILYAPRSGTETRTNIRRGAESTSKRMGDAAMELKGNLLSGMEEGGDELGYLIGSAMNRTALTAKEIIKALEMELRKLQSQGSL